MPARIINQSCDRINEVAMGITEHVAALGQARQPIATDVPLMLGSLDPSRVVQLHSWLQARYDWEDEKRLLFDEEVTAEGLARDIVGKEEVDNVVMVVTAPSGDQSAFAVTNAAPVSRSPAHETVPDIGMAPYESWTGKSSRKAGMLYGLLGLGFLGSPMSPSIQSPGSVLPLSSSFAFSSPLHEARAPSTAYTPIFSPWLKTVRFPAMEAVQSPWIPTHTRRSSDGLWAFPQSPRGFCC